MVEKFLEWIRLKFKIHSQERNSRFFSERQIWWCAIGENIGREINGKSQLFSRPVLIFKKLNAHTFIGLPLSTREKEGSWFVPIIQNRQKSTVLLHQIRIFDEKRLYSYIGEVDDTDWSNVIHGFQKFFTF